MLSSGSWSGGMSKGAIDAFGRQRISSPTPLFESQFTYDLQPLIFEQVVAESDAAIAHDATNRNALLTFASTPTGGIALMQSYEYIRYQPSRSQIIFVSFNFIEAATNCRKFAGLCDGNNGFQFVLDNSTAKIEILSDSTNGDQAISQNSWNLDKLDGTGSSGLTLDITKANILVIDFQALYTGRVRFGFDMNGHTIYVHEFKHANNIIHPYVQDANLPIRVGMTCTGTVSTTMKFTCAAVSSESGTADLVGYNFTAESGSITAASGARTHLLSVRPKTTFNSKVNRIGFQIEHVNMLVTGSNPVFWELVLGQAITGASYSDTNTTYSAFEQSNGTISGSPAIVIDSGYVAATNQSKSTESTRQKLRYPIALNRAGAVTANGTLSLLVTGLGGTSACRGSIHWRELR